ncbi:ATP-grasp domain-containing protein [Massilia atriviolacea]|uniref:ATP-grasp domain-containing protein n=1 Tax=Massilia atriviolacea TaxID=2495579 RepID=A0A430HFQ3_9BURK|nr:ATP-grasp domain-containing protein [Massilia atriviolacea]RSZ56343.1 ATP-grasp domain-containing protein [Massilia atriviolacea]
MPKVLILGGRAPVAADHARRFAGQGWTVHIGDSIPCRSSGWSHAVRSTIALASPRFDPAGFIAGLSRAIAEHAIDLVVPTCEEVFYLSRYRHALPSSCRILADDFDKLRSLHSKWDFLQLADACGGKPPASALVHSIGEAIDWAAGAPAVLKPEFSRFGVHVRIYPEGIAADAPALADMGRWVVQHYRPGQELCSYSVAEQGRLLAHAVYLPKYRLKRSSSYYFAHHASERIAAFAARFVARQHFTGQISFDWIDAGNDSPAVIECNPRAISGVHLFGRGDVLPAALDGTASGLVTPSTRRARMIAPVMASAGLAQALANRRVGAWRRDFLAADDVLGVGGDRLPIAGAVADMGSYLALSLRQRCTLREVATRDIEWDGEALAQP